MNFDDMAFAHMLKDYSVFSLVPRLSYAIQNWFVFLFFFVLFITFYALAKDSQ